MNETIIKPMPRIGEQAPAFEAKTTHGTLTNKDFEGRWWILFSHPSDFTPVCTSEFIAFQEIYPELKARNTDLIGLSVDSVSSHIAWVLNVKEKFGVELTFPIIADLDQKVATDYGMLMPEGGTTEASRAVFIIDPNQTVRTIIYYPLSLGRNMQEILRALDGLQTADEHMVSIPANWVKGDKVIVKPPKTQKEAEERAKDPRYECVDWYFCKKEI
ncbi:MULTISPECIES: peroxiredoxin [Exiguobacterium]|uniref:peroxiredoxin n=1 Tax=Exiguobacterium TaxID=33986 RepID=UPI0008778EA5|nr:MULTISPECIES: peroxiredoxin [Exiguobacterium]TCI25365.1 peroxiredoxin [Exiguobacterium sp. SH5S4]TCI56231.1 peroxiredoxin [Exiguobacterium sp. SH5S13]TCI61847.1 peroxiredoxin [Exiguobacterium sp. SH3S1]